MTRQPLEMNLFFLYVLFVVNESMVKILLFDRDVHVPLHSVRSSSCDLRVKDSLGDFVAIGCLDKLCHA